MLRVLVVGVPRGGTTWVGQALGHAEGAAYVHEPDGAHDPFAFRSRFADGLGNHAILDVEDAAPSYERLWRGAFAGGRLPTSLAPRLAACAFAGLAPERRRLARRGESIDLRTRAVLWGARPLGARSDVDAVVVKSVNAALSVEWIYEHLDRPKVLVVRRDPRNVLASWSAMGFGPPGPRVIGAMTEVARRRWHLDLQVGDDAAVRSAALCACLMLGLHDGLRRHPEWSVVSHEAACRDPEVVLAAAAAEVGLEFGERARTFVRDSNREGTGYATDRVAQDLPDQWRERLSTEQIDAIESIMAQIPADLWLVGNR
jgi:hypothetical protein